MNRTTVCVVDARTCLAAVAAVAADIRACEPDERRVRARRSQPLIGRAWGDCQRWLSAERQSSVVRAAFEQTAMRSLDELVASAYAEIDIAAEAARLAAEDEAARLEKLRGATIAFHRRDMSYGEHVRADREAMAARATYQAELAKRAS